VVDLDTVNRSLTLLRLGGLVALLLTTAWLSWQTAEPLPMLAAALLAGAAYALLLIGTHEAVHGKLLGMPRLEFALSCLISWPMAWPFATYASLHLLHHRWNGRDPRDPERTEPLAAEQFAAGPLRRWQQRHPLVARALGHGGLGLIASTYGHGVRLRGEDHRLTRRLALDVTGSLLLQTALLALALSQGVLGRYLLFWLVLERAIGVIVQSRGVIEHHGLWGSGDNHLLTQLYATRSVGAAAWLNLLMGGLPHHAAHHAFPAIPFHQLPLASQRIEAVLNEAGRPALPRAENYLKAVAELL
jgi:fatty acid desaturase